jgi:hypothetical protein
MGFIRFRRSVRILPRVRLNVGKTGVSTSIGGRGAHVTLGHGQTRTTVGLPGTGLSYTEISPAHEVDKDPSQSSGLLRTWVIASLAIVLAVALAIEIAIGM